MAAGELKTKAAAEKGDVNKKNNTKDMMEEAATDDHDDEMVESPAKKQKIKDEED